MALAGGFSGLEDFLQPFFAPLHFAREELVLLKFGQLTGSEHRVVAHENGRRDFRIAKFAGVQIEHELRQRPLEACETIFEYDKTRA